MREINEALDKFMGDPEQKVLMLKGAWGTGKTYYWKNYFKSFRNTDGNNRNPYAYVSLFGTKSIVDVKASILMEKHALINADTTKNIKTIFSSLSKTISKIPINSVGNIIQASAPIIEAAQNYLLKDMIICFDDLERKDTSLPLSLLLGYISFLKEEKNCKIIIILNEDALLSNKEDKQHLDHYREKVIDREILYAPNTDQNIQIAFGDKSEGSASVNSVFQALNINNIRVMKQCKWLMDRVEPIITSCELSLKRDIWMHLSLLTAVRYESGINLTLEDLSKYNDYHFLFAHDDDKDDPKLKLAMHLQTELGFMWQDYDPIFVKYLNHGLFESNSFRECVATINEREKRNQISQKMDIVFRSYNSNFQASADDIERQSVDLLNEHAKILELQEIATLCDINESIGKPQKERIHKWANDSIRGSFDNMNLQKLHEIQSHVTDEALKSDIRHRIEEIKTNDLNPMKIISHMCEESSWSEYHIESLRCLSVSDLTKWLQSENDPNLLKYLQKILMIFKNSDEEEYKEIYGNLCKALTNIASLNPANRSRVQRILNIDLPEDI